MKVLELRNISREEGFIYYRRKFKCDAIIEMGKTTTETPLEFCIESNPLGAKTIEINLSKTLNYPVLPVKKALTEFILTEDSQGKLPL